jgi:hypothetical protein
MLRRAFDETYQIPRLMTGVNRLRPSDELHVHILGILNLLSENSDFFIQSTGHAGTLSEFLEFLIHSRKSVRETRCHPLRICKFYLGFLNPCITTGLLRLQDGDFAAKLAIDDFETVLDDKLSD